MMIDIGAKIKSLRLQHSMTQEQLAQKLGVSAQAVSKWESGTNMPDIQLLPDLSVTFGVTIDALFDMTDECRMERIENGIYNVRFLAKEEFAQQEKYLLDAMGKPELCPRATLLLAMLYNKRANEYHDLAKPLAREALHLQPEEKDAHNAIFDAEGGAYQDWNCINHRETIEYYKTVIERHPQDLCSYFWLLDLLIADRRTAEAREYAARMKEVEHTFHYEMYMGYICQAECNLPEAQEWWGEMTARYAQNWVVWVEMASIYAKLGRYAEAEEMYLKTMPMRPKPRFTDCEDAVSQLRLIRGDIAGAIEMQKQMLAITREDWTTEGESVDSILREIKRLEAML